MKSFVASIAGRTYFMKMATKMVSQAIAEAEFKNLPRAYDLASAQGDRMSLEKAAFRRSRTAR